MLRRLAVCTALLLSLAACRRGADKSVPMTVTLASPSFASGQAIPARFTCSGANVSPALSWQALPAGTKSLALFAIDQDSLFGFVHWSVYNLPPQPNSLPEDTPHQESLSNGARQGQNGKGEPGYTGPCPPGSSQHHYEFTIYALNDSLAVPAGAGKNELLKAMQGHVLAAGRIIGTFQRR